MKPAFFILLIAAVGLVGCESMPDSSVDPFAQRMAYLERGHAKGHVTASTDGTVGVGSTQALWVGAPKSNFSFEGEVDYSRPIVRELAEITSATPASEASPDQ